MTEYRHEDLRDAIHLVVELQLGIEQVTADDRLTEDLGADSFDLMNIIVVIEHDHRIAISETDAAGVHTVGDLVTFVSGRKGS